MSLAMRCTILYHYQTHKRKLPLKRLAPRNFSCTLDELEYMRLFPCIQTPNRRPRKNEQPVPRHFNAKKKSITRKREARHIQNIRIHLTLKATAPQERKLLLHRVGWGKLGMRDITSEQAMTMKW